MPSHFMLEEEYVAALWWLSVIFPFHRVKTGTASHAFHVSSFGNQGMVPL